MIFYNEIMIHLVKNLNRYVSNTKPESWISVESLVSTVKGYLHPNSIKEFNPNLTSE
jgi:hypothetical protein